MSVTDLCKVASCGASTLLKVIPENNSVHAVFDVSVSLNVTVDDLTMDTQTLS